MVGMVFSFYFNLEQVFGLDCFLQSQTRAVFFLWQIVVVAHK
jgi:hypothetical protein